MEVSGHLTTSTFHRYNITDDHDLAEAMEKVTAYTDQRPSKIVRLKTAECAKQSERRQTTPQRSTGDAHAER